MLNTNNFGIVSGRLVDDVKIFTNKDNSKKVMFKVAVNDVYKDKNGNKKAQFIPFESIIAKNKSNLGVYDYMHKGDKVTVQYSVRNNNYEKDGQMVYGITLFAESISLESSKKKNTSVAEAPEEDIEIEEIELSEEDMLLEDDILE